MKAICSLNEKPWPDVFIIHIVASFSAIIIKQQQQHLLSGMAPASIRNCSDPNNSIDHLDRADDMATPCALFSRWALATLMIWGDTT